MIAKAEVEKSNVKDSHLKERADDPFSRWHALDTVFCVFVALILYLRFFRFPNIPILATGDQSVFLSGATRMLDGQLIYKDFFQFTTPGTEYLYYALIRLFGQNATLPAMVTVVVGVLFAAVGVLISRSVFSDWRVYLGPLLFLTAGYIPNPDATHHVFSTLAILAGLVLLLRLGAERQDVKSRSVTTYLIVGALCAVSSFFTPTRGLLAMVGFSVLVFTHQLPGDKIRLGSRLWIGFLIGFAILMAPVVWEAGVANVWAGVIDFPLHHYRAIPWNDLSAYGTDFPLDALRWSAPSLSAQIAGAVNLSRWLLIYVVTPGIYILFAVVSRRESIKQKRNLSLIVITGIALFLSIAYSPNQFRLGVVSLPAFVLLAWLLGRRTGPRSGPAVALGLFSVITFCAGILHSQRDYSTILNTPTGQLALPEPAKSAFAEKFQWVAMHTARGDFFFAGENPDYYFPFKLRNPSPVPYLTVYDYTTPEQVRQTLAGFERQRVQYIFWPAALQPAPIPAALGTAPDHLAPIRDLLQKKYRVVHTFSDGEEVWERNREP